MAFDEQAAYCDSRSPLYAALCRSCAGDPLVAEVAPDLAWDLPLRLLGALHYLALAGEAPELAEAYAGAGDAWPAFRATLAERGEWIARFLAEQSVQTNEVQRSYALLPGFLTVAREAAAGLPLDLIELGPSAGLNLVWDRYRYRYSTGEWGPRHAGVTLTGDDRRSPPAELLRTAVRVRRRRGIDLSPVDVTTEHGARLLQAFVWADQHDRLERLRRAIEVVREDPPELIAGDYVELLPRLLAERDGGALTVVYETASRGYLEAEALTRLRAALGEAGTAGPLAWLATRTRDEEPARPLDGYALELRHWPGGEERVIARLDFHGAWLEWLG